VYFCLRNDIELNPKEAFLFGTNGQVSEPKTAASAREWYPIGSGRKGENGFFSGVFDGNGYTVSGIYLNAENENQGLFGYCIGATIKNLTIADGLITNIYPSVGGILGYGKDCTVENCENKNVTLTGTVAVGGVVGINDGGVVTNCRNSASYDGYIGDLGGIAGENYGTVSYCVNNGKINSKGAGIRKLRRIDEEQKFSGNIAGIVSTNCGTVENCENNGTLVSIGGCGGIVHTNKALVRSSVNKGSVSSSTYAGGIVALNVNDEPTEGEPLVTDCKNTSAVAGTAGSKATGGVVGTSYYNIENCENSGTIAGISCVGGIVGSLLDGTLEHCLNAGNVNGKENVGGIVGSHCADSVTYVINKGDVKGTERVGGIAGEMLSSDVDKTNAALALAYAVSYGKTEGERTVGGIVGANETNYATLTLRKAYNRGELIAADKLGGIIGSVEATGAISRVEECYNAGTLTCEKHAGGVFGLIEVISEDGCVSFENCYYLETSALFEGFVSDPSNLNFAKNNVKLLEREQMWQALFFEGFDFAGTWTMSTDKDYLFPVLQFEQEPAEEAEAAESEPTESERTEKTEDNLLTFTDVGETDYFRDAVSWAVKTGVTNGAGANLFRPNSSTTRAETVTFLWRAAGSPSVKNTVNPFRDVPRDAYYYTAVLWAVGEGITTGTSDDTFSPNATVTRAQTVTFLARMAGIRDTTVGYPASFDDVKKGAYYFNAVAWAKSNGIASGTTESTFSPNATCTRAQTVTFLYRALAKD